MIYIANISTFFMLCVFPIAISANIGRGGCSLLLHMLCILSSLLLWKIDPKLLGNNPEYIILIIFVTNFFGFIANLIA